MKLLLPVVILLTAGSSIYSQTDTAHIITIPEVIIHENRIQLPLSEKPSAIIILGSEIAEHSAVQSIADLLHYVPGIDIRQRGSNGIQSDAGIRGSSFDQVLILLNGIKISDPQTGHHSLNLPVDISNIDHIEVFKGSAARVFGQNAFAGAINIITKNPDDKFLRLQAAGGEYGLAGGTISASLPAGKIKNYLSLSHNRSSGYKYNTDYGMTDVFYQSEVAGKPGTFSLLSAISDRKFGANGFYSGPGFKDQYESVQTSLISLGFKPEIRNQNLKLISRIYWRRNRDEYLFIRNDPAYYRNKHINNTAGIDLNMTFQNRLGVSGIGLDLNVPWITSNRLGNRSRKSATLFIDHRFSLLKGDLNIIPGLQANFLTGFENNILPGIDIGYSFIPALAVFLNSGYTYRVPTFTDLYYEDPANSSNSSLEPEYALSNEFGFKTLNINGLTAQASYFFRKTTNLIDRSKENPEEKWQPHNIGEVLMSGLDFNLTLRPDQFTGKSNFIIYRVDLGYTYIRADVQGKLPAYSKFALENLRNQITIALELKYFRNIYQTVNLRYSDRVNLKDFVVADTRIGLDTRKFGIFIDVTNVFNEHYMETNFVTLPGRWFKAGASFKLFFR